MGKIEEITTETLNSWIENKSPFTLLDVLPEEYYKTDHLPGALNACVYKMDFIEDIEELVEEKSKPIVVYGSSINSLASTTAAEKLIRNGYSKIYDYRGGINEWKKNDLSCISENSDEVSATPVIYPHTLKINPEESIINWIGRGLASQRDGTIAIAEGILEFNKGIMAEGSMSIDISSIKNNDLPEDEIRKYLIEHLLSDDFFDIEKYQSVKLVFSQVTFLKNASPGSPNYRIIGNLTLKNVTREIEFLATGGWVDDNEWVAQAHFDFDRTQWNVLYGSGKFYENLGMHLIADLVTLNIVVSAQVNG